MQVKTNDAAIAPSEASRVRRRERAKRARSRQEIVKNLPCPTCREKGADSTGNHLMVFKDGTGYCNRCPKKFSAEEVSQSTGTSRRRRPRSQSNYEKKLTIEDIRYFGYLGDSNRNISPSTDEYFGIRTEVNTNNRQPIARYYPYHVEQTLYGFKTRGLPKDWKPDIGTIKGTDLFGWHLCTGVRKTLIITEGEEDCAAGWQLWGGMNKRSSSSRIKRSRRHIVSLPNGAKGIEKVLMHHIEDLLKYEKIIWMGDNYKTDPDGLVALQTAVRILGMDRVFVAEYPAYKKDLCDILKLDTSEAIDVFSEMYFKAKNYRPADIVEGKNLKREDVEREQVSGIQLPLKGLNSKLDGLRLYEHTLLFAGSGIGKSTVAKAIGHFVADTEDWMVGNIFLEEGQEKTQQSYIAYDNHVSLRDYRKNFKIISDEDWYDTRDRILDKMIFLNHMGSIDPDVLMDKIRYMHAKGCKLIILDHISMVVTQSDDERKDIDNLMEQIYTFCETHPVHVLSIVHLNRAGKLNFERGAEISSNNLRGSAGLLQMCWNAIGVEGDNQHEEYFNHRFFRFLKCRETGEVGLCQGAEVYNPKTGHFEYTDDVTKDDLFESYSGDNKPTMGGSKYDNKSV